jgi:predicted alpha/beta superfamily hydrolase
MLTLNLELSTLVDDERPVFISGNFCEWTPNISTFEMQKIGTGKYAYTFPDDFTFPEKLEYKYTRGGWNQVELDAYGDSTKNRITRRKAGILQDFVPFWRKNGQPFDENLMPKVQLISDEFEIPQLNKKRRISILLPHDYAKTEKKYPVLYLQDAQNLFGEGSTYGNWEIDKRMAIMAAQGKGDFIVVAIEHGEEDRLREYSPYTTPRHGRGLGKKYANFIVRTLKPFIDKNFRTKPEPQFTGIGGSSMGGLVSIYAGLMYPETIGKLMIFSPSLWVSPKIYFDSVEFFNPLETKIYMYAGAKEGKFMIPSVEKLKETIEKQGWDKSRIDFNLSIDLQGKHNEERWGKEFPKAIEWLFY